MGKKRIVKNVSQESASPQAKAINVGKKRRIEHGILQVRSTFNNTAVLLTDEKGNAIYATSSGALGFKGAKKGTPFAAAKAGEMVGDFAKNMGIKDVAIVIKGVGSGRESAMRSFISKGINILSIRDVTPVAHNGVKSKKPRRV